MFSYFGSLAVVFAAWSIPILLVVWLMRIVTSISASLRDIADRMSGLERAVRETARDRNA